MNDELAKQFIQAFSGALKGLRLYPLQHPATARQVQNFLNLFLSLSGGRDAVRVGMLDGALFLGDHLFTPDHTAAEELAETLQQLELEGIIFKVGVTDQELLKFLALLHAATARGDALVEVASQQQIDHIEPVPVSDHDESEPREVYGRALTAMKNVFEDVRLGKIPSSADSRKAVKEMAEMTISEPHALFALSMLKDYDNYTFTHSVNVSVIALTVGRACGLGEEDLRILGLGGLFHDLGKLKIDVGIITKPGRLTESEFDEIRKHPGSGAELVGAMEGITKEVIDIVLGHHLRYDRTGYPADAKGRVFSHLTDMASIADTYDALTTLRSYQSPTTPRKAIGRLRELMGNALHPEYTERFITSLGTYPVGTLVRLDSNEIGLVVRVGLQDPDAVELKMLFDGDGKLLDAPPKLALSGAETVRIVGEVDPFLKGIDVTEHFR